ncbi:MAG: hypothetical protein R2854_08435 [Caldilineaceae bacterium]
MDVNPMFAQVAEMFGIVLEQAVEPDPGLIVDLDQQAFNIFHVPGAVTNAYIPDQPGVRHLQRRSVLKLPRAAVAAISSR